MSDASEKRTRTGAVKYRQLAEEYFAACQEEQRHPSMPGLALALGLDSPSQLGALAAGGSRAAQIVRRAMTRVEEANVQSLYKKDSSGSAKFILQSSFGYSEKAAPAQDGPRDEIVVTIQEEGDE